MASFGSDLRQRRERAGISLEHIASVTKVSTRHLQALEEHRFDVLPGGVFNKGILRGYLAVVGLDEQEWMPRFAEAYRESGIAVDDDNEWLSYAEKVTGVKPSEPGGDQLRFRWWGVLLLLLAVAAAAWAVWRFVVAKG